MTKRLISLMLAVLMLAVAFVSCADDGDAIDNAVNDASRYTSTINMWVITESALVERASELLLKGNDPDKYPEETYKQNDEQKAFLATLAAENANLEKAWRQLDDVCDRINDLTKKRFKTQVNIKYFTEETYYTKLEGAFLDMAAAKAEADKTGKPIFAEPEEEENAENAEDTATAQNSFELKYPTALEAQVDIVYVSGAQNYFKYVNNGWLAEIKEDDIPNSAPQLVYHLTSALLSAPKFNGMTYAIPNNNPLGEYTYLAVNTELANKYYIDVNEMGNSLYSSETQRFLQYVYNEGTEGLYPIYSEDGKVDFEMLHYWTFGEDFAQDPSTFSLFGGFYNASTTPASGVLPYRNLFTQQAYIEALKAKTYYENTADFITQDASAKAAVRVVKGTVADKAELEGKGYTVLTAEAPRISDDDVFGSMFAIGAITRDKNRNLEIIAMLNTESEIRNLLQYGIEGTNYTLKTAVGADGKEYEYADMKADNLYVMDVAKTGNMFVAYPNAAKSDFANGKYGVDAWANAKKQNLEATLYPTLGLNFSTAYQVDVKALRILNAVSAKFKTVVMDNLTTVAAVEELIAGANAAALGGNAATSAWILGLVGEVTYVPAGATEAVAVSADELTLAIAGLASSYSDAITEGSVLSTKVLCDEWWLRNYGAAK